MLVPGLLQTEAYAQALLEAHFPPLDEETVEQRVAARVARQALLTRKRPPIVFVFIVEESAVRRAVGDTSVVRQQLEHLLECSTMRSTDHKQHVYVEVQDIVSVRSDRHEVSEFRLRYGTLRTQALNTEESSRLIQHMEGEL
ncbi:DUF5753 domain-containing protein [Streptomyces sp. AC512_CC834]|uniref:DUF5753 domain-containing protein n=1 Tax=Streptomyces sp. AC512_CC834 TaxID=2823691 RepID=UPI0027E4B8FE|nr:DUF5753 domain-containing protein [Streptomyces sp. AC512_CC834]